MNKNILDMIYEDIWLSHRDYSSAIFDSMLDFIEYYVGKDISNPNILNQFYIDYEHFCKLKQYGKEARHFMRIRNFVNHHNEMISSFNFFLENNTDYDPIPEYKSISTEYDPTKLPMKNLLKNLTSLSYMNITYS